MAEQTENAFSFASLPLRVRLGRRGDPGSPRDWETGDDDYVAEFCLTASDVPELLDVARKWTVPIDEWPDGDDDPHIGDYAPVLAWRGLAHLRAVEAVPVLLDMLDPLDDAVDDWSM